MQPLQSKGSLLLIPTKDRFRSLTKDRFQLERHGYFVADRIDHRDGRLVFNRTATLKDSFAR